MPSLCDSSVMVANTATLAARRELLASLPSNVRQRLRPLSDTQLLCVHKTKREVQRAVASIVGRYSRSQSLKGMITAGGVKTVVYVAQKLRRAYFNR
jgi:Phosphatidate cytidylyltransferase, mitochondrial